MRVQVVGPGGRIAFAVALLAVLLGGRGVGAVTFNDPAVGLSIDLTLPRVRLCVLAPVALRERAGCEGLDVAAVAGDMPPDAALSAVVRQGDTSRVLIVRVNPRIERRAACLEEADDFLRGIVLGISDEGGHLAGDAGFVRDADALSVDRGVQVMAQDFTYVGDAPDPVRMAHTTLVGRNAFVTMLLMTTVTDAAPARGLMNRLVAQTQVTPVGGDVAWRPRPAPPTEPVVFRDLVHGITFDANVPNARVCVVRPAAMRDPLACEGIDAETTAPLDRPEAIFAALVLDAQGTRVLTVNATSRQGDRNFYSNEDADDFVHGVRQGLGDHGRIVIADAGPIAAQRTLTIERGVQAIRHGVTFGTGDDARTMVNTALIGRDWIVSLSLVSIVGDLDRSRADLDRVVGTASVTAPAGTPSWGPRRYDTGQSRAHIVVTLAKLVAVCAFLILVVRRVTGRR